MIFSRATENHRVDAGQQASYMFALTTIWRGNHEPDPTVRAHLSPAKWNKSLNAARR